MDNAALFRGLVRLRLAGERGARRPAQRSSFKGVSWLAPAALEARYARLLRDSMKPLLDVYTAYLTPERLARWSAEFRRADTWTDEWAAFQQHIVDRQREMYEATAQSGNLVGAIMDLGEDTSEFNRRQWDKFTKLAIGSAFNVDEPWLPDLLQDWGQVNRRLITNMEQSLITKLNEKLSAGIRAGVSVGELQKTIQATASGMTRNRARLIARDQVGKLNGELARKRQMDAGLKTYRWQTSGDERVRGNPVGPWAGAVPSHYAINGRLCDWNNAAVMYDPQSERWVPRSDEMPRAHPGEEIQCRCIGVPDFASVFAEVEAEAQLARVGIAASTPPVAAELPAVTPAATHDPMQLRAMVGAPVPDASGVMVFADDAQDMLEPVVRKEWLVVDDFYVGGKFRSEETKLWLDELGASREAAPDVMTVADHVNVRAGRTLARAEQTDPSGAWYRASEAHINAPTPALRYFSRKEAGVSVYQDTAVMLHEFGHHVDYMVGSADSVVRASWSASAPSTPLGKVSFAAPGYRQAMTSDGTRLMRAKSRNLGNLARRDLGNYLPDMSALDAEREARAAWARLGIPYSDVKKAHWDMRANSFMPGDEMDRFHHHMLMAARKLEEGEPEVFLSYFTGIAERGGYPHAVPVGHLTDTIAALTNSKMCALKQGYVAHDTTYFSSADNPGAETFANIQTGLTDPRHRRFFVGVMRQLFPDTLNAHARALKRYNAQVLKEIEEVKELAK